MQNNYILYRFQRNSKRIKTEEEEDRANESKKYNNNRKKNNSHPAVNVR